MIGEPRIAVSLSAFTPPDETEREARTRLAAFYRQRAKLYEACAQESSNGQQQNFYLNEARRFCNLARRLAGEQAHEVQP